jgi:hypothetical protein
LLLESGEELATSRRSSAIRPSPPPWTSTAT